MLCNRGAFAEEAPQIDRETKPVGRFDARELILSQPVIELAPRHRHELAPFAHRLAVFFIGAARSAAAAHFTTAVIPFRSSP